MATDTAIARLLLERGAGDIQHPGGTLSDHLSRVQQRLAQLGAPEAVQLAARAHAVYGTDGFDVTLLGLEERPLLAGIIGDDAEQLVYRYGACDRDRTWDALADTGRVWNRFTSDSEVLDQDQLRAFTDLSIVNELDIAEQSAEFLDRHGDYFRRLTSSWAPVLSEAVLADARRVLDRP
ncbi:hypothetical protein DQ239_06875 [Blastococcus sp. TF02-09]|uniref:DUF6817 domain-containing protein n=1 Tax=Blastococcus sp. TF02-09 TaxID=2250576 RepID=UPI000DEB038D|nr:hypothetical protein [Blastococcus sp. TF02-9]RBY79350.1 hypothetical protein DQ239_06875 [Blastococcus sp. TF02-9]